MLNSVNISISLYRGNLSSKHIEGAIKTKFGQNPTSNIIYKEEKEQVFSLS